MCLYCYASTNVNLALTWSVPVDVAQLGASLSAYQHLRPMILQLRLCNRYGSGDGAHIARLPQELIDMVIDYVMDEEIKDRFREWNENKACHYRTCMPMDHFNEAELDEMRDEMMADSFYDSYVPTDGQDDPEFMTICEEASEIGWREVYQKYCDRLDKAPEELYNWVEDRLVELTAEMDSTYDVCNARKDTWEEMTRMPHPEKICSGEWSYGFGELDKLLKSAFGLQTFISRQTVGGYVDTWCTEFQDMRDSAEDRQITLAFLTLPCLKATAVCSDSDSSVEWDYGFDNATSLFTIVDPSSLQISEQQKQRFIKTMQFLHLRPYLSPLQIGNLDFGHKEPVMPKKVLLEGISGPRSHPAIKEEVITLRNKVIARVKEFEESSWPKLLNLVSVKNFFNDSF